MGEVFPYRESERATKRWSKMERPAPVVGWRNGLPVTAAEMDTAPSEYSAPENDPA